MDRKINTPLIKRQLELLGKNALICDCAAGGRSIPLRFDDLDFKGEFRKGTAELIQRFPGLNKSQFASPAPDPEFCFLHP